MTSHRNYAACDSSTRIYCLFGQTTLPKSDLWLSQMKLHFLLLIQDYFLNFDRGVEYLRVEGSGIESGDSFQFYYSDPAAALASCHKVSARLRSLNLGSDSDCSDHMGRIVANACKPQVLGGFIFSSFGRGESFFNDSNVDSLPFVDNFPGVPVAGIFCGGEIGRCSPGFSVQDSEEETSIRRSCHVYSTVYLVMSYAPAPSGTTATS